MLVIFDLDDTLIDTTGCLTPMKLELALHRMIKEGLVVPDFEQALSMLKRLDRQAESARQTLEEFIEIHAFDRKFLQVALEEVYEVVSDDLPVFPMEEAGEVLQELQQEHLLALVSIGNPARQREKLKKAGIDSGLFCKILISEERNKQKPYELLLSGFHYHPEETIVCGDRIALDLTPAKQLGCKTVHMKRGRGVHSRGGEAIVDFTITTLRELQPVILHIQTTKGRQ